MPVEIRVPPLGESLVDAVVGQWLKQEGDAVSRGETVVELETDKVNLDVTAEDDGVIARIDKREGDTVTVGEILGIVGAGSGNGASEPTSEAPAPQAAESAPASAPTNGSQPAPTPAPAPAPAPAPSPAPVAADVAMIPGAQRAAPAVRRLAEEYHLDLNQLAGSGPGGRITREDVLAAAQASPVTQAAPVATAPAAAPKAPAPAPVAPAPAAAPSPDGREERVRLSRRRQTIATRLVQAQQTAAMLTTFNEVDMTAVMELRARRKEAF